MTEHEKAAQGFGGVYSRSNYPGADTAPPAQAAGSALKNTLREAGHFYRGYKENLGNNFLGRGYAGLKDMARWGDRQLDLATAPSGYTPPPDTTQTGKLVDQAKDVADSAYHFVADPATTPVTPSPAPAAKPTAGTSGASDSPGNAFGKNLLLAGGLGLGAVGTYYLLNKLMSGRRRKYQSPYGPPKFASFAGDTLNTIQSAAGKAKDYVVDAAGKVVDTATSNIGGGNWLEPSPEGWWQGGVNKAMGVGGLAAGLGGAYLLKQHLAKRQKRHNEQDDIEAARNEYLEALTGAKSAALDEAYEKYANLADWINSGKNTINQVTQRISNGLDTAQKNTQAFGEGALAAELLAAAGGTALGGYYMYNKTRNNSRSANALKAQAMKARMRSLPGTWIDPEELVKVKQMALANNAAAT